MAVTRGGEPRPALWTYEELCDVLGVDPEHRSELRGASFLGVVNDPLSATRDSLFIPTRVANQAALIQAAFAHGATAALTNAPASAFPPSSPVIRVGDPVQALAKLARAGRDRCREAVGITGSVGKSTVHAMALDTLAPLGRTHGVRGNFNLRIWLHRVMAVTPPATDFGVFEIAGGGPGYLGPTAATVRPTVGVVTAASEAHGAKFAGVKELIREKVGLLDHLIGPAVGIVGRRVLEADQQHEDLIAAKPIGRLITVGTHPADTVRLTDVRLTRTHTIATVTIDGVRREVKLPLGRPFAENAAFVFAIAHALGVDLDAVVTGLAAFQPPPKRIQRLRLTVPGAESRVVELIDDSWNASPSSVRALLEVLAHREPRRKIFVLGDMRELGPDEVEQHRALAPRVLDAGVDVLVTVGVLAARVADDVAGEIDVLRFPDAVAAGQRLRSFVEHGDLVGVKGSASVGLKAILPALAPGPGQRSAAGEWAIEDDVPSEGPREKRPRRVPARSTGAPAPSLNGGPDKVSPATSDDRPPALWRYEDLCRDLGLEPDPSSLLAGVGFTSVSTAWNTAGRGALFVPLVPPAAQPQHIARALARGAGAALTTVAPAELPAGSPVIQVKDTLSALDRLAVAGRARASGDVVAVLRNLDFAPAKALLVEALSAGGPVHTRLGTDEFHLRRILAVTPPTARDIVVDVSGGAAPAMRRRAGAVRPSVAVLASDGDAAVALALLEKLTGRRVAIVGPRLAAEVAGAQSLPRDIEVLTVGTDPGAHVRLRDIRRAGPRRLLTVEIDGRRVEITLGPGDRRAIDAVLYALATAHVLGRDIDQAIAALQRSAVAPLVAGQRIDVRGAGKIVEIVEDLRSPAGPSLRLLLRELSRRPNAKRRVLVLADPPTDAESPPPAPIADALLGTLPSDEMEAARLDLVITVGEAGARLMTRFAGLAETTGFPSPEAAAAALPDLVEHGDLIATASAAGHQLWPLREALAHGAASPGPRPAWRIEREVAG